MRKIIFLCLMIISVNLFASNELFKYSIRESSNENHITDDFKITQPDAVCFTILTDYNDDGEATGSTVYTWNTIGDMNCADSFGMIMLIWSNLNP